MTHCNAPSQVALLINLPDDCQGGPAGQVSDRLAQRLAEDRLPATWIASTPRQSPILRAAAQIGSQFDAGLRWRCGTTTPADACNDQQWAAVAADLSALRAAGMNPTTLWVDSPVVASGREAALVQLGIRALATPSVERGTSSDVRLLAEGLWCAEGAIEVPENRLWSRIGGEVPWKGPLKQGAPLAVVAIDLARVGGAQSRGMREIDRLLTKAAWAHNRGTIQLVGLGQWARRQMKRPSGQPQQSILKAA